MSNISLQTEGRRIYVTGNTYPFKDQLKAAGAKFDGARKAWWIGVQKRDEIERAVAKAEPKQAQQSNGGGNTPREGLDSIVAGRGKYKGRTYYLAGREERGRTHWDDGVVPVQTRDGAKYLLYFRDGSKQFWAAQELVEVGKIYQAPKTIRSLREYAECAKQGGGGRLENGYYYGRGGEVLASGCSECASLGHMCPQCEHDYY